MEYGGITPIGLPEPWLVLVDAAVLDREVVVIGSGLRRSKLALRASALPTLPNAEVI
jgi:prolyl-tRNA editing enzyme YbaK/EbsC (Cys-tRNA(Pro) deacylase)